MSRVHTLSNYTNLNIVNITQKVENNKNLVLDLWNQDTNKKYSQIFLLLNNLKISNKNSKTITFEVSDNHDLRIMINTIEDKAIELLKVYLAKINKKGKFSFNSNIKDLKYLELKNENYDIYDNSKNKITSLDGINKMDVIVEVVDIVLDMVSGIINLNMNLSAIISKINLPTKTKLSVNEIFDVNNNQEQNVFNSITSDDDDEESFISKGDNEVSSGIENSDSSSDNNLMSDKIIVLSDSD